MSPLLIIGVVFVYLAIGVLFAKATGAERFDPMAALLVLLWAPLAVVWFVGNAVTSRPQ